MNRVDSMRIRLGFALVLGLAEVFFVRIAKADISDVWQRIGMLAAILAGIAIGILLVTILIESGE